MQSFEIGNLRQLNRRTEVPLVQLIDCRAAARTTDRRGRHGTYADMATPPGLKDIATYADWRRPEQGPASSRATPTGPRGRRRRLSATPTRPGCVVHLFTFRNENQFMAADFRRGDPADPNFPNLYGNAFAEYAQFFNLGVDGLFSDNPDTAIAARGH